MKKILQLLVGMTDKYSIFFHYLYVCEAKSMANSAIKSCKIMFAAVALIVGLGLSASSCKEEETRGGSANAPADTPQQSDPCLTLTQDSGEAITDGQNVEQSTEGSAGTGTVLEDGGENGETVIGFGQESDCFPTNPGGGSGGSPPADPGAGSPTGWNIGPGIDGCEAEGKSWIAVVNGAPGVCGDPLVTDWCCTRSEVLGRFPQQAAGIGEVLDAQEAKGLKLYHCSVKADGFTLHMAAGKPGGGGASYYGLNLNNMTPVDTGNDASACPQVTLADLGIDPTAVGSDENPGDAGVTIPSSIPGLTDLTAAGLKQFVEAESYSAWTADAAVHDADGGSPHGKVKSFFNDAVKASLEASNTEHPVGSIIVKELYDEDETTRKGWAMEAKISEGTEATTWLFYYLNDGEEKYGAGIEPCAACHADGVDYVTDQLP